MTLVRQDAVIVTGGSGYLGGLVAASLLVEDSATVILPIRPHHSADEVIWHIAFGVSSLGREFSDAHRRRLRLIPMASPTGMGELGDELADLRIVEIVHCAGCLDYFDAETLQQINVELTRHMLELGKRWGVERFTYLSTAYSCGYISGTAPESPHETPAEDPTDYTRTKRDAETLVVDSGLPFHIIRPSIVIGTLDGRYTGKRYGVYQLWNGFERLMCRKWAPVLHAVAPDHKLHLVHQDSFQRAYLASRRDLPANSFLHVTTPPEAAPSMRQLWDLWFRACARPQRVVYYESVDDLPMREIETRQRAFLSLAWTNLQISSRHWCFATDNLARLRQNGLVFEDVTAESLENCQRLFVQESAPIQTFLQNHAGQMASWPPVQVTFNREVAGELA
jgi:nucleoside-diphosphate-sugar epimerase